MGSRFHPLCHSPIEKFGYRQVATQKKRKGGSERAGDVRLRKRIAPSKHSGESSLSPNDPSSSETMMSAGSGTSSVRMSPKMISTEPPHSSA